MNPLATMTTEANRVLSRLLDAARETRDPRLLGEHLVRDLRETLPQASWAGIYWLRGDELVLGPYAGPPTEHTTIPVGRGVCGRAVRDDDDQVVTDVREAEDYLACSPTVRSEIVVLLRADGRVIGQIDLDSERLGAFGEGDHCVLRTIADSFAGLIDLDALDRAPGASPNGSPTLTRED